MDPILIIAAILVLAAVVAAVWYLQKRRSDQLRSRFGPEYSRAVEETGDRRKAESRLLDREKRVEALSIRPLPQEERDRFSAQWRKVQAEFVDAPSGAVGHADALLGELMSARGYPVSDFEQVAEDISVDHPVVVENYRAAHDIAVRHERGEASTEDLRKAMIHYRELFEELVGDRPAANVEERDEEAVK
jgi:hypothetical protein